MSQIENMTEEEFIKDFGIAPGMAKKLMERLRILINVEVRNAIAHADYYINPTDYCDAEWLKERYGEDVLEKDDDDDDGYINLYEYGREHGAVETFMDFISWHTSYGGHSTAIRACDLIGIDEDWGHI